MDRPQGKTTERMEKVTAIGGFFFEARDPERMSG
jgi:hypothetical protein